MKFLRRYDDVADAMNAEELKDALADKGQMTLNVVRASRALRQIVVLEQETMGLREPAVPRGIGAGSGSGGGRGNGKVRLADLSDPNDLNDLEDLEEYQELRALYDFDEPRDVAAWENLAALEKYGTWPEYEKHRKAGEYQQIDEVAGAAIMDDLIAREAAQTGRPKEEIRVEHQALLKELRPKWAAEIEETLTRTFETRRAALMKLRAAEKAWRQGGRGPPAG